MSPTLSTAKTAVCVLLAMLILGVVDNLIRLIAADIGLHQFHFVRALIAMPVLLLFMRLRRIPIQWHNQAAVLWRGALVGAAMYGYFAALAFLPIGTVVAGLFTAPIFVLLINLIVFKHQLHVHHVIAVAIGFLGMVCITLPDHSAISPIHALPVAAGALYAASNVIAREYCQNESTGVLMLSVFAALGGLGGISLITLSQFNLPLPETSPEFITAAWRPLTASALGLTALHAVSASLALGLLTFAYQRGLAIRVAVLEYSLLIFASVFAWFFWAELPTLQALIGMALIAASGLLISRDSA